MGKVPTHLSAPAIDVTSVYVECPLHPELTMSSTATSHETGHSLHSTLHSNTRFSSELFSLVHHVLCLSSQVSPYPSPQFPLKCAV